MKLSYVPWHVFHAPPTFKTQTLSALIHTDASNGRNHLNGDISMWPDIVWTILSSILPWQQWNRDSCMCERALIGFHLMVVRPSRHYFSLSGLGGVEGVSPAFCRQWSMSAYRFEITFWKIPDLYVCVLTYTMASKIIFMPHLNCMNTFRH